MNVTATDLYGISSMWYTFDNGISNTTFSNSTGIHFEQANGVTKSYTIFVYVNDTYNNLNSSSVYVTIHQTGAVGEGATGGSGITSYDINICSLIYDFIIDNYESGIINYTTLKLDNLTMKINNLTDSSFSTETIIDYILNYNVRCKKYKEIPTSIQFGLALESIKITKENIWKKCKYEIIFCTLILLGIFGFEYLRRKKRRKHEKKPVYSSSLID